MKSERLDPILVRAGATVREVIEAIDAGAVEIALVVDGDRRLLGTITDGDVRRALLRGVRLEDEADPIVHRDPATAPVGTGPAALLELMSSRSIEQVPLLDDGVVVDLVTLRELATPESAGADQGQVVIMAGGEGQRLRPLTENTPKPMLKVGDRPLLERIVEQVRDAGFEHVVMAVNYRSDVIEGHFGDGSEFGVDVEYLREEERLGSAGALGLMRDKLTRPFIVVNADLLTGVNFAAFARFHREEGNVLTVGVRQCVVEVPYGVVELNGLEVAGLTEKPSIELLVNAGMYVVSPEAVRLLPEEIREFNMTDLIEAALAAGQPVGCFPIREYWLDIGQLADYERAESDHATYFSPAG